MQFVALRSTIWACMCGLVVQEARHSCCNNQPAKYQLQTAPSICTFVYRSERVEFPNEIAHARKVEDENKTTMLCLLFARNPSTEIGNNFCFPYFCTNYYQTDEPNISPMGWKQQRNATKQNGSNELQSKCLRMDNHSFLPFCVLSGVVL